MAKPSIAIYVYFNLTKGFYESMKGELAFTLRLNILTHNLLLFSQKLLF